MAFRGLAIGVLAWLFGASALAAGDPTPVLPPAWTHETDAAVPDRGMIFTVPGIDDLADFHGNPDGAELVLYVGGNYYFLMPSLVRAFTRIHPAFAGRVYWETLPPGLLLAQIKAGGLVSTGNLTLKVPADVYLANLEGVRRAVSDGTLIAPAVSYVTNTLTIMVPRGNPAHVQGLADLGRPGLRLCMPNPAFEGVAGPIKASLIKAGGQRLEDIVYGAKVADRSTFLTRIHHRQTPMRLVQGLADAGVVWQSEARYQEEQGQPIGHVDIPPSQNSAGIYAGAVVKGAPHGDAGRLWLDFLHSSDAIGIFTHYGFSAYRAPLH